MANASIKIGGESKGAESAIKKVTNELNKLSKNKALEGFNKINIAMGGVTGAVKGVVAGIQKAAAVVNDLTETYKVQAQAEKQLEVAARNNPYLNSENVTNLKNYASQLQSISVYGDEELIPLMGQLAAAGRTEQEIMDIMSASIDIAASGTMSLDSAVQNLNKTYSGTTGQLGKTIPQLQGLTKAELQNGEAVKIVAKQYKGMAEETAKATGSAKQLSNAWGDFKEHLGEGLEGALAPFRRALTGVLGSVNTVIANLKEARKQAKLEQEILAGTASQGLSRSEDYQTVMIKANEIVQQNYRQKEADLEELAKLAGRGGTPQDLALFKSAVAKLFEANSVDGQAFLNAVEKMIDQQQGKKSGVKYNWSKIETRLMSYFTSQRDANASKAEYEVAKQKYNEAKTAEDAEKARAAEAAWNAELEESIRLYREAVAKEEEVIKQEQDIGNMTDRKSQAQARANASYQAYMNMLQQSTNTEALLADERVKAIQAEVRQKQATAKSYENSSVTVKTNIETETKTSREQIAELSGYISKWWDETRKAQAAGIEIDIQKESQEVCKQISSSVENIIANADQTIKNSDGTISEDVNTALRSVVENAEMFMNATDFGGETWQVYLAQMEIALVEGQPILEESLVRFISDLAQKAQEEAERTGLEKQFKSRLESLTDELDEIRQRDTQSESRRLKAKRKALDEELRNNREENEEYAKDMLERGIITQEEYDRELKLYEDYAKKRKELSKEISEAEAAENAELFSTINSYVSQLADLAADTTSLIQSRINDQTDIELGALSQQYTDGLISYEEFCEKKEAIDREAAQKKYKLDMINWGASMANATASIAEGVAKALTQGFPLGLVSGALVTAAGAVQLASIMASKPQPPSFAAGGIVPGTSWTGDKVNIHANSGEMILNDAQQARLFAMANGSTAGSGGVVLNQPITIENNAGVSVRTQPDAGSLRIVIDEIVNDSMSRGRYTNSMHAASMKSKGVKLL